MKTQTKNKEKMGECKQGNSGLNNLYLESTDNNCKELNKIR